MDPVQFLLALMQLYSKYPFSETGGQRTRSRNIYVDGVAYSPHQFWVGRDVVFDQPEPLGDLEPAARRLGLKIIKELDHHHIQPVDWIAG